MKNMAKFLQERNNFLNNVKSLRDSGTDRPGLDELCVDCIREMAKTQCHGEARRQLFRLVDLLLTEGIDVSSALPEGIV